MKTDYAGIDYGHGQSNVGEHGIRYGVIPMNALYHLDELESVYACGCPHCGAEIDPDELPDEYECECGETSYDYDCWSDEPIGYRYDDGDIILQGGTGGDVFVIRSPVKIRAQFCSPCAPGACYLPNPCDHGAWCYALPLDWFDPQYCPAPYSAADLVPVK